MVTELEEQLAKLDTLLESYLNLLDTYESARKDLSKSLSMGFLSLARANSSTPGGRRYGQDYYDFRTQATRRVYITEDTPPIISVQETKEDSTEPTEPTVQGEEKTGEETTKVHCNPLNWYGVLVPNTLKDTQKSFTRSVEQSIPDVLNATAKLRQIEIDIGRTRKTIKKLEKSEVLNSHTADAVAV